MTTELFRFAVVMVVVVLGFVNALHALLLNTGMSYYETWKSMFTAMLGDVEIFDYFTTREHPSHVGIALVVAYFVITNIMLLNLLVGLLTTEYERVQEKVDVQYKVSKTRLIQHYSTMVERDLLPAPFNLVQAILSLPFFFVDLCFQSKMHGAARAAVGSALFWMVSGIIAVPVGSLLWIMSSPRAVRVFLEHSGMCPGSGARPRSVSVRLGDLWLGIFEAISWMLWCLVGAPLCLLGLWLRGAVLSVTGAVLWIRNDLSGYLSLPDDVSDVSSVDTLVTDRATVGRILGKSVGMTITKLRRHLANPMIDPEVREDEKSTQVTVEHMKLLRNRLETELVTQIARHFENDIGDRVRNIEERLSVLTDQVSRDRQEGISSYTRTALAGEERARGVEESLSVLADQMSLRNERLDRVEQKLDDVLARLTAASDSSRGDK